MKTEEFTDPAAFRAALTGQSRRASTRARQARPDLPRAARAGRGEGDRQRDLNTLAARGWTMYCSDGRAHWFRGDGGETPRRASYGAAVDAALEVRG